MVKPARIGLLVMLVPLLHNDYMHILLLGEFTKPFLTPLDVITLRSDYVVCDEF